MYNTGTWLFFFDWLKDGAGSVSCHPKIGSGAALISAAPALTNPKSALAPLSIRRLRLRYTELKSLKLRCSADWVKFRKIGGIDVENFFSLIRHSCMDNLETSFLFSPQNMFFLAAYTKPR